jgi:1-deoxy-D-xylulose-5-phosphate reductoisomerase
MVLSLNVTGKGVRVPVMKSLAILGSTGSIGTQSLECISRNPDCLRVVALAAGKRIDELAHQVRVYKPKAVAVSGPDEASALRVLLDGVDNLPEICYGADGLEMVALHPEVDSVLNGLVGAVGLVPTLAALRANREVLLANKESLVMAGELIRKILESGSGKVVPVDSEHSAIFQCLDGKLRHGGLTRIILTASGGPFFNRPADQFATITVEEALAHPTWKMGPKISIDSATLMNKGLEIIEAHYLFNVPPDKIDAVIHPASIVHSVVEFADGCMLAQLSHPTMQIPIQYALLGTERRPTCARPLNLAEVGKLEFFPPDNRKFPALELARSALRQGGTAPTVLNGANEEAVKLFLDKKIGFMDIPRLVEKTLEDHSPSLALEDEILTADLWARERVRELAV